MARCGFKIMYSKLQTLVQVYVYVDHLHYDGALLADEHEAHEHDEARSNTQFAKAT